MWHKVLLAQSNYVLSPKGFRVIDYDKGELRAQCRAHLLT
jgi:hypothetical protein